MNLLTPLRDLFRRPCPPTPTAKQTGRKADAIRLLIRQGFISLRDIRLMGDNSPAKTVMRMRLDGVLNADAADPRGFRDLPANSYHGAHRRYLWTGRVPAGWPDYTATGQTDRFTDEDSISGAKFKACERWMEPERRARRRGGR